LRPDALLVDISNGVLRLTINRPEKRNALSLALLDQIGEQFVRHADRPELQLAIITGAEDKCFAAGGDLQEFDAIRSDADSGAMAEKGRHVLDCIRYFPLPVIAGLNGLALGGGAELALAADIRVAAAHAELGLIQSQLNVTTAWGGGIDLIGLAGNSRALEILAAGKRIPADIALASGIVNHVIPDGTNFNDGLDAWLKPWLTKSPQVLRGYKATNAAYRKKLHSDLDEIAHGHFVETWTHDDHWDAAKNALKK
jgi:enoyl-CoA hydratase